jgi:hypothetical protein
MKYNVGLFAVAGAVALLAGTAWTAPAPMSGPAENGSPGWRVTQGYPDPVGRTLVDDAGNVTVMPRPASPAPGAARPAGPPPVVPNCSHTTICTRKGGPSRLDMHRVVWDQTPGYTITYPFHLPPPANAGESPGSAVGVAVDSHDNVWILQRKPKGQPQLYKFGPKGDLLLSVPGDVLGFQEKAHALATDASDNVWVSDSNGATVKELSPDGKLLRTIGSYNVRGDWDEAKGQHLLWQPNTIAFAPNGDMYIGEGHANESPNDVESDDPADTIGAARVLHFDKDGKFIGQFYGDDVGPGKFDQVHVIGIDPKTGDLWIGDREQYRWVIYTADGQFLRTIQTRNLTCEIMFAPNGKIWTTSGQDGQVLRIDRNGKVLEAVGGGMGIAHGQFIEAGVMAMDKQGDIYVGDTSIARTAKITPPKG